MSSKKHTDTWKSKKEFKMAIDKWIDKIKVRPKEIHIRIMKKKWASYSQRGRITFNKELLKMKKEFGEYVILHEMLHMKIPNHGKMYKRFMDIYMPSWEKISLKNHDYKISEGWQ